MTNVIKPLVTAMQRELGFDALDVDGIMGPKTYEAVLNYQRHIGLEIATSTNETRWSNMTIRASRAFNAARIADDLISAKPRYMLIQDKIGVPWWFTAALHMRESACAWDTYLGNGEPLKRRTRLVPKGRGPFESWTDGAVDALVLKKFDDQKDWSIGTALDRAELYNGLGYKKRGLASPYLWSWSNQYSRGKYIADHVFDPDQIDGQVGVAVIWKALKNAGEAIGE